MAYQTGTASSRADLISKLSTFAVAAGWTQDEYDSGTNRRCSLHKGSCYVHFWWDDLVYGDSGSAGKCIAMYQSLGYSSGQKPYNHTDDSGGYGSGVYENYMDYQRMGVMYIGDGPFTAYHFFSHTDIDNIYVVLEYTAGIYRHFGFGNIDKFGTWTGGEWVGGHRWHYTTKSTVGSTAHNVLLDGMNSGTGFEYGYAGSRLHIEGFPNQVTGGKWGLVGGTTTEASTGLDRSGKSRLCIMGGFRKSWWLNALNWLRSDALSGLINLVPIPIFYRQTDLTPNAYRLLGFMHNVYHIQMAAYEDEDEITIGSNTYKIFSMVRKRYEGDAAEESMNAGIAYKKVT
jgi:hypothetical protein